MLSVRGLITSVSQRCGKLRSGLSIRVFITTLIWRETFPPLRQTWDKLSWHGLTLTMKTNILGICPTEFFISRSESYYGITSYDRWGHFERSRKWGRYVYIVGAPSGEAVRLIYRQGEEGFSNVPVYQRMWRAAQTTTSASVSQNTYGCHVSSHDSSFHLCLLHLLFSCVSPSVSPLLADTMVSLIEQQGVAPVPELFISLLFGML